MILKTHVNNGRMNKKWINHYFGKKYSKKIYTKDFKPHNEFKRNMKLQIFFNCHTQGYSFHSISETTIRKYMKKKFRKLIEVSHGNDIIITTVGEIKDLENNLI